MDKEIEKLMKDILKKMDKKLNDMEDIDKITEKKIEEHSKKPCKLSIEKGDDGEAKITVIGTNMSILIGLAGLEKAVLKKLNPPAGLFEHIKRKIDTMEV